MGWACDTYGGEDRFLKVLVGNLGQKDHLEDLCVDGRIISKWISRKTVGSAWSGLILLRIGVSSGLL